MFQYLCRESCSHRKAADLVTDLTPPAVVPHFHLLTVM